MAQEGLGFHWLVLNHMFWPDGRDRGSTGMFRPDGRASARLESMTTEPTGHVQGMGNEFPFIAIFLYFCCSP